MAATQRSTQKENQNILSIRRSFGKLRRPHMRGLTLQALTPLFTVMQSERWCLVPQEEVNADALKELIEGLSGEPAQELVFLPLNRPLPLEISSTKIGRGWDEHTTLWSRYLEEIREDIAARGGDPSTLHNEHDGLADPTLNIVMDITRGLQLATKFKIVSVLDDALCALYEAASLADQKRVELLALGFRILMTQAMPLDHKGDSSSSCYVLVAPSA